MSDFKYYDTLSIKQLNPIKRIAARKHNEIFYIKQDKLYGNLLAINGYPLDSIQRKVVYSEDKYTMVIAAAGSGKTTTMIGKIKYLIKVKNINPKDIITISFTNESVNSFKNSLKKNGINNVNVLTFHKLALNFINKMTIIEDYYLNFIIQEYMYSNFYTEKANIIKKAFKISDYTKILNNMNYYVKQISRIINLCHTNNYFVKDFINTKKRILKKAFYKRATLLSLLYIIMDIYYIYQEEKNGINAIDFDDMIILATNKIKSLKLNYKYIIVDEYQDTSLIRVRFLQNIIKQSNAHLLVVGDDYQSIYRFNGCDLNIFLNFKRYFSNPKIIKLQNTYRNSQNLIDISKKFILKNPFQIKKKIKSNKTLINPIKIVYYSEKNKALLLKKVVDYVKKNYGDYLILGRNNFDLKNIVSEEYNYLTVHKSKGLEANNVIIINLENSIYGFPNKIKELEIEKLLFSNKNNYPYDEERRLFYVALTRTRNYVFLFVNKKNSSIFIEELIKYHKIEILRL